MTLGNLHKLLAEGPALGLAVLCGLREWEHGRLCSKACGPTQSYKPTEWGTIKDVGYVGSEDEEVCVLGGGWEGNESKWGGSSTTKAPPPAPTGPSTPPHKGIQATPSPRGGGGKETEATKGNPNPKGGGTRHRCQQGHP